MAKTARRKNAKATTPTADLDVVRGRVAAVLKLAPQAIDADAIRVLVGNIRLRTLGDVATVFSTARNTVQTSWRQAGCPGSHGAWNVADILVWLLQREQARSTNGRGSNPYNGNGRPDEMKEIAIATARANQRIREARAAAVEGDLLPRSEVESGLVQLVAVSRDAILGVPRRMQTMFPARHAEKWAGELDRELRLTLALLSEYTLEGSTGEPEETTK